MARGSPLRAIRIVAARRFACHRRRLVGYSAQPSCRGIPCRTLHPQIVAALETMKKLGLKPIEAMTPAEARAQMEATAQSRKAEPLPIARVEERDDPRPGRADPRAALLAECRRNGAGDRLLSRWRACHRQPRYARSDRPQSVRRRRCAGRLGRLPDGAGAPLPGGGRGLRSPRSNGFTPMPRASAPTPTGSASTATAPAPTWPRSWR